MAIQPAQKIIIAAMIHAQVHVRVIAKIHAQELVIADAEAVAKNPVRAAVRILATYNLRGGCYEYSY